MKKLLFILFIFISVAASGQLPQHMMHVLASQGSGGTTTLKTGLISVWEFNEASGDAVDAHGSNDGTNTNITYEQTTVSNLTYSYGFNGSSSYTSIPNIFGTSPSALSVSLWAKTDDTGLNVRPIELNLVAPYITLRFHEASVNNVYMFVYDGTVTPIQTTSYTLTNWTHIVITSVEDGDTKLYINGTLINTVSIGTFTITNGLGNIIGARRDLTANYFDGLIDQVAIWSKVLTTDEVSDLNNSGNGLPYTSFGIEWFILLIALRKQNYHTISNLKIAA